MNTNRRINDTKLKVTSVFPYNIFQTQSNILN